MSTNIQMNEGWAKAMQEHDISLLQLERIIHLYRGAPHEVKLHDIITGNKFLVDMDDRCRSHISMRQRVISARERIFVTSYR